MGNISKKMGNTNDNDDNHPPLWIESDKDASPKLDIIQADGVKLEGNSNDVHPGLPDGAKLIPVVVNGLTALTTDVHMGIAAIRGFQWIEWKCMCIQQGKDLTICLGRLLHKCTCLFCWCRMFAACVFAVLFGGDHVHLLARGFKVLLICPFII